MFGTVNKSQIVQNLSVLGLSTDEAELYYFLLKNGPQTPLVLSRKIDINRSKIYRITEKLKLKKLIEESDTTWGKMIGASHPEYLKLYVEKETEAARIKQQLINPVVERLSSLIKSPATSFEVKYYRGTEGIKQQYWNFLSAKTDILIFGYRTRNEIVGKKFAEKSRAEHVLRKVKIYEIANPQAPQFYDYTSVPHWKDYYQEKIIPEKLLKIRHQICIYDNMVSIINWYKGDKLGVEIENKYLADTQRQMFWHFWELANKSQLAK